LNTSLEKFATMARQRLLERVNTNDVQITHKTAYDLYSLYGDQVLIREWCELLVDGNYTARDLRLEVLSQIFKERGLMRTDGE
jgi:hypothetical protein